MLPFGILLGIYQGFEKEKAGCQHNCKVSDGGNAFF